MNSRSRLKKQTSSAPNRRKHLPLLFLASLNILWILFIVTSKFPNEIANLFIYQAYFPLLVPFLLGISFLFGFITLNIRHGILTGIFLTLLLLFKLQQIHVPIYWIAIAVILFGILVILTKKSQPKTTAQLTE